MPLPMLRMIDLARALARDPQLLLLDEITAALPSDLAERVFAVMRRQKERRRSVLFITHRLREVIATCDRATILRDGSDVGRSSRPKAARTRIVEYMLGPEAAQAEARADAAGEDAAPVRERVEVAGERVALEVAGLGVGERCTASRSPCGPARSSASRRSRARARTSSSRRSPARTAALTAARSLVDGRRAARPASVRRDPGRASCSFPADRLHALLPQRSVRENIAAPRYNATRPLGPDQHARGAPARPRARSSSSRSTRARSARCAGSPAATSRR